MTNSMGDWRAGPTRPHGKILPMEAEDPAWLRRFRYFCWTGMGAGVLVIYAALLWVSQP